MNRKQILDTIEKLRRIYLQDLDNDCPALAKDIRREIEYWEARLKKTYVTE